MESSNPSPTRSLTYLRQSPIKTVAASIYTNQVKNSHRREYNTNQLRLPGTWSTSNDNKEEYKLRYLQHLTPQVYKLHIYWSGGGLSENWYIWLNLGRKLVFLHIFNATWPISSIFWHILTWYDLFFICF